MMVAVDRMAIMRIMATTTNRISEGEVLQLLNTHSPDVSEAEYLETINRKTAKLFESAARLLETIHHSKMIKNKSGKIINVTSVIAQIGNAGQSNYAASKAGIIGLTKSIAKELASRNINVNSVAPGYIETDMTNKLTNEKKEELKNLIPLGRIGKPIDIANLICFLASDEASYITGQTFNVDGGMVMI